MGDDADSLCRELMDEVRLLLAEVRAERMALFQIVLESGHMPTLHRVADMFEAREEMRAFGPGGAPKKN